MNRLVNFSPNNPTGEKAGMEPVRLDLLKAAVNNQAPERLPAPVAPPAPPAKSVYLVNKTIRLPSDLIEFIDYSYTKDQRMKKQDAYTEALEAFFRPLMTK